MSIDNGIWLCSNCATLIDKDPQGYSTELLMSWKKQAELESQNRFKGGQKHFGQGNPFIEVDLIRTSYHRRPGPYSERNNFELHHGIKVMTSQTPIIYWDVSVDLDLVIYNNSNFVAFNIQIANAGTQQLELPRLSRVNNLPPLQNWKFETKYGEVIEGTGLEVNEIIQEKFWEHIKDMHFVVKYLDEGRSAHTTIVKFDEQGIINEKA